MKGSVSLLVFAVVGCRDVPEPIQPPPIPTQDRCPAGFGAIGPLTDGCYREIGVGDWVKGEQACEEHESEGVSAHLLVVDRDEEHAAFGANAMFGGDLWVGRLQQDPGDAYRNINYVAWDTSYYGEGEPNDYGCSNDNILICDGKPGYGDERCIEYKTETGMWNDEKCYRENRVFCEWDTTHPYGWRPGD